MESALQATPGEQKQRSTLKQDLTTLNQARLMKSLLPEKLTQAVRHQ